MLNRLYQKICSLLNKRKAKKSSGIFVVGNSVQVVDLNVVVKRNMKTIQNIIKKRKKVSLSITKF